MNPRELLNIEICSPGAAFTADQADAATKTVTMRHLARTATLQTVPEARLALAHHTKPQQQDPHRWRSRDIADLYRNPLRRGSPGWNGPAILLVVSGEAGATATTALPCRIEPASHIVGQSSPSPPSAIQN